jgi:hypothetical protein
MTGMITDPPIAFTSWNPRALAETRTTIEITNSDTVGTACDGEDRIGAGQSRPGLVLEGVQVVGQIEHCGASFVPALVDGDARRAVEDLDALDEALASQHAAHICHRHRVAGASDGHHRGLADHDRPGHRRRERVDGQRMKGRGLDLPAPGGARTSKG